MEAGDGAALRRTLELERGRADAAVPLARLLFGRGEVDEALRLVEPIAGDFGAEGLTARIRLQQTGDSDLDEAFAALDAGEIERGLDKLLEALAGSADGTRDDLRRAIVGVLDVLGAEDPRAREYRRRLAAALY
jgi:putative thioredoxin